MNLFKNAVGRPSNEIKRKRKIIILTTVISIFILIFFVLFLISENAVTKNVASANSITNNNLAIYNTHYTEYFYDKKKKKVSTINKDIELKYILKNYRVENVIGQIQGIAMTDDYFYFNGPSDGASTTYNKIYNIYKEKYDKTKSKQVNWKTAVDAELKRSTRNYIYRIDKNLGQEITKINRGGHGQSFDVFNYNNKDVILVNTLGYFKSYLYDALPNSSYVKNCEGSKYSSNKTLCDKICSKLMDGKKSACDSAGKVTPAYNGIAYSTFKESAKGIATRVPGSQIYFEKDNAYLKVFNYRTKYVKSLLKTEEWNEDVSNKYYEILNKITNKGETKYLTQPEAKVDLENNKIMIATANGFGKLKNKIEVRIMDFSSYLENIKNANITASKKVRLNNYFTLETTRQGLELIGNYLYVLEGKPGKELTITKYDINNIKNGAKLLYKCDKNNENCSPNEALNKARVASITIDTNKLIDTKIYTLPEPEGLTYYNGSLYMGLIANCKNGNCGCKESLKSTANPNICTSSDRFVNLIEIDF